MAERAGFEPARQRASAYPLSRRAPSTNSATSPRKAISGGESEIRTHGAGATRPLAFEASAFNHSAISPLGLHFVCSTYSVSTLISLA